MQNHTVMSFVVGNTSFTTPQLQTLGTIHMPDDLRLDRHHSFITMIAKVVEPYVSLLIVIPSVYAFLNYSFQFHYLIGSY